jgi:molybdopterin/thiamine biosynthesis adenylyltransferase
VIHYTADVDKPKVESAAEKMRAINPDVQVRTYHEWVRAANIRPMIRDYDFVIDGTDNFIAKFLINDACVLERKPFSHGAILCFDGQTMTVRPGESACYRCAFRAVPPRGVVPSCSERAFWARLRECWVRSRPRRRSSSSPAWASCSPMRCSSSMLRI